MSIVLGTMSGPTTKPERCTMDAGLVKHLRQRGVVILGKLGLSEFANFFGNQPSGFSNLTGQVINGIDADQNVSGSPHQQRGSNQHGEPDALAHGVAECLGDSHFDRQLDRNPDRNAAVVQWRLRGQRRSQRR